MTKTAARRLIVKLGGAGLRYADRLRGPKLESTLASRVFLANYSGSSLQELFRPPGTNRREKADPHPPRVEQYE